MKAVMPLVLGAAVGKPRFPTPGASAIVLPTPAPPPRDSEDGASPGELVNTRPGAGMGAGRVTLPPSTRPRYPGPLPRRDPAQPLRPRYPEALPPRREQPPPALPLRPRYPEAHRSKSGREFDSIK